MQTLGWAILEQDDGWQIARAEADTPRLVRVESASNATASELAKAIAAQFTALGYRSEEDVILCLASGQCLPAKLASNADRPESSPAALAFQLEELLPLSSEQFVADFIRSDEGLLGIAVEVERVQPLVQALEVVGISIRSIIPATLLVAQWILQTHAGQVGVDCLLLVPYERAYDVVQIEHGIVTDWLYIRGDSSTLEQNLWMLNSGRDHEIPIFLCHHNAEEIVSSIADLGHYPTLLLSELPGVVSLAASAVLFGKLAPVVDLRRDKLASRSPYHSLHKLLAIAALAACLFLSTTIVGLEYRSWCCEQSIESYQRAMEQIFQQVFPKQPLPLGIRSRLDSEHSKTVSLRDSQKMPEVVSVIEPLRFVLASLPDSIHYRFSEINVQGRQLKMDGEVRSHGDAAVLASRLSEAGFDIQPPRTVQIVGGNVTVTLTAEFRPVEKSGVEKPTREVKSNQ